MARTSLISLLLIGLIGATAGAAEKPQRMSPLVNGAFITATPAGLPASKGYFNENFEQALFPPAGWSLAGSSSLWSRSTDCSGYGSGSAAALANFYSVSSGTQDMVSGEFWPSSSGDSVIFDHAYAAYSATYVDSLTIWTSINGGTSWVKLIGLRGGTTGPLNTAGTTTAFFVPTSGQWATKRYALPVGTNRVRFRAHTAYGNNLYLDNIRVTGQLADHDVYVAAINAPRGQILVPVDPQVVVKNNGNNNETFMVTVVIDSAGVVVYADSMQVTGLVSGDTVQVNFPTWSMGIGNIYNVTAYTALDIDQIGVNDTVKSTVNSFDQFRRVYVEDFTAQWCGYCPYVQNSLEQLREECGDSIIVVGVHPSTSSDSFYTTYSAALMSFYGDIGGYPTTVWDGGDHIVGGWSTVYNDNRAEFNLRKAINSPFSITLSGTQDGNTGTMHAEIYYPGGVPINGNIKMVVTEESKYCVWPSPTANPRCDSMREFLRAMFPSAAGDPITISQGTTTKDINFTLHANWNKTRLYFIVYVNNMTTKEVYNANEIRYAELTSGVAGEPIANAGYTVRLYPVSPNPVSGNARFSFDLAAQGVVSLGVYDVAGRLVARVVDGTMPAGSHSVSWNGTDRGGRRVANGVYFVRLDTESISQTRRLTVIR